jgi:pimeloyl-ACP methyl ester carboxylesterase
MTPTFAMQLSANGTRLEVEDHGSPAGEPLLLVMGLGMQLLGWHEDFVAQLVERGFRVIRFDNRDIGLSQSFDHLGVPSLALESLRHALGFRVRSPYALADMAKDAIGILDALGIEAAHVCGASMGGMIAQHMARIAPTRVKSLTLMMTSSGARHLPAASLKVRSALISRPPANTVEGIVEHYVKLYALIGSPAYPSAPAGLRERFTVSVRRSYRPAGTARQMVAIAADGDRSPLLGAIRMPTQIIHGVADPLVPVAAGRDLKAKIPEAKIDLVEGMGHDLPMPLWPRFVDGIAAAAGRS